MPGFNTTPQHLNQAARPEQLVYTYTWDLSRLIGDKVPNTPLIYLRECTPPSYNFETETVKTGHAHYEFAKQAKWNDVKLSFYDTEGLLPAIQELADKVWTPDSGIRLADEYVDTTILRVHFFDDTFAYSWTLHNSWIKSISFSRLTYENSGVNNVNVTVAYSWATRSDDE